MTSFIILPAAGRSVRMGTAKLLLPWGSWTTLLDAVLEQWCASPVDRVVCVARGDDKALQRAAARHDVDLVIADPPPSEMKVSVMHGLTHVRDRYTPRECDAWLLAPADLPHVSAKLVGHLLQQHESHLTEILIPTYEGRRGHPVLFPWPLAAQVEHLANDQGINSLTRRFPVLEIPWADPLLLEDVDTPQDYERLRPPRD